MNHGKSSAENGVMRRRCRGLTFGIAVALVCLTAGPVQSGRSIEPGRGADRQTGFERLMGEYRGMHEGDALIVWVETVAVEAIRQAALLIFREQDKSRLETYLKDIIDRPAEYYRKVCDEVERVDNGYRFLDFYKVWDTQGGLILLQDGFQRDRVPPAWEESLLFNPRLFQHGRLPHDWEEIEGQAYPVHLRNREYLMLHDREYAIWKIRRSLETGALESVHLTQTGYIQNFFDNPVIGLTRVEHPSPSFKLLGPYLDSKFHALEELGHTPWRADLPEVCKAEPR